MYKTVYAMRVSTCQKLGIQRVSFLRGRKRVGEPIFMPLGTGLNQAKEKWVKNGSCRKMVEDSRFVLIQQKKVSLLLK